MRGAGESEAAWRPIAEKERVAEFKVYLALLSVEQGLPAEAPATMEIGFGRRWEVLYS